MEIAVQKLNETTFEVSVKDRAPTVHRVTVPADYHQKLTAGRLSRESLVERSFEFLLQREPNTSILRQFDLPVIQTYFPDYEKSMKALSD